MGTGACSPDDNYSAELPWSIAQNLIINIPIRTQILEENLLKLDVGSMAKARTAGSVCACKKPMKGDP